MCFQIIKNCWEDEENSYVVQKMKSCAESLDVWSKEITSYFNRRIKDCNNRLRLLPNKRDDQSLADYEDARKQLFLVLD